MNSSLKNNQLKLVLSNSYGTSNVGDQAILVSMIELLRRRLGNIEIDILSRQPDKTRRRHPNAVAVRSGVFRGFFSTCECIKKADLLIFGGGGVIQDSSSLGNLIFHLSRLILARLLGTPFIGCGLGIGPINSKLGRRLTSIVLNCAQGLFVRDKNSATVLFDIGVNRPQIVTTCDFVFGLNCAENVEGDKVYQQLRQFRQKSSCLVGLSLRPEPGRHKYPSRQSPRFMEMLKNITAVCDKLIEQRDASIVFVSMDPVQDQAVVEQFLPFMHHRDRIMILPGTLHPKLVMSLVGLSDIMIGMRLHSLIFAARCCVPMIALSYDPKVTGFIESMGLHGQILPICDIELDRLFKLAIETLDRQDEIKETIRSHLPALKSGAERNIDTVTKLLTSRNKHD